MGSIAVVDPPSKTLAFPVDETEWPALPPTQVTIHRTSPLDEQSRQIYCAVDGHWVATLTFGRTHTHEIPPGRHSLRVHNTLMWKTLEFEVEPGAHIHFTVANRADRTYYPLIWMFGVAPLWLVVERGAPFE